ncbi:C40 family peptidase [Romeria aff. gracilis LEGE 07310]|uniref:C40 family peptidase n=1 Tax=Vasconcelosia minhoensis LEGE 07310 TaxID=915328 RepID=A0A8J7AB04_9CYAN|nr:C40 family peptidase [Romeria gracilis]MBE9079540.1 C40 family peptidase [Romeria aff. gracilis LEGE 07310]
MLTLERLKQSPSAEYRCDQPLNLYQSPTCEDLTTQADRGRHLQIIDLAEGRENRPTAVQIRLCEDDYPGWIAFPQPPAAAALPLSLPPQPYQPTSLTAAEIQARLPAAIAFTRAAEAVPNQYLWGGTVAPNYDCSGLMQAAFAAAGIRIPRDSYQQEAFTQPIAKADLHPGDLIFFGTAERTNHVALYLGNGSYIHSSGRDQGRNGIGIDSITDLSDPISAAYQQQLRSFGRIVQSYRPAQSLP